MLSFKRAKAAKLRSEEYIATCRFELHAYDPCVFDPDSLCRLSEADFVVKFWAPIMEKLFLGSDLRPQWGGHNARDVKAFNPFQERETAQNGSSRGLFKYGDRDRGGAAQPAAGRQWALRSSKAPVLQLADYAAGHARGNGPAGPWIVHIHVDEC
ncbi:hypothetical protein EC973_001160 [Apophysomyces ossiformis]|uniref:Uncharacterized protein n=1 Tax=Apophysomyces ossiformis TaxID=679940 RepID=A0A8H7BQN1_9FUNG|nr:hypothetical protein EC973_001160 [Apophysomyces ossiformis]